MEAFETLLPHEFCDFCCHEFSSLLDEVIVSAFQGASGFQGIVRNEVRLGAPGPGNLGYVPTRAEPSFDLSNNLPRNSYRELHCDGLIELGCVSVCSSSPDGERTFSCPLPPDLGLCPVFSKVRGFLLPGLVWGGFIHRCSSSYYLFFNYLSYYLYGLSVTAKNRGRVYP